MKLKIIKTEKRYQKCLKLANKAKKNKKLEIVLLLLDDYENKKKVTPDPSLSILFPNLINMKSACQTILNGQYDFFTEEEKQTFDKLCIKFIKCFDDHKKEVVEQITEESNNLVEVFSERLLKLYEKESSKNWSWFEDNLTYANSILPE